MGAGLWLAAGSESWWFEAAPWTRAARLGGVVILGAGAYFASLWILGFRPRDFSRKAF
jgi:putative peptidoglycan lipid II flippase